MFSEYLFAWQCIPLLGNKYFMVVQFTVHKFVFTWWVTGINNNGALWLFYLASMVSSSNKFRIYKASVVFDFFFPPWTTLLSTTFHRFSARSSNLHSSRLLWMCVTISLPRSCLCRKKCIECTELNKTLPELYEICKKYLIFERYFTSLWFRGKKMVFHLSRSFCR